VFTDATCANCHKVEDVGRHVGPDLSRLVDRSPRSLLVDTIDPNRVVDHRFIEHTAVTTSGLQVSGMLFDETEDRITLADLKGELYVVRRQDLDELVSHQRSQMPEGLEANCTLQQMADLIAFLARAVPIDGQRDATPEPPSRATEASP
jgi:putative heme-binding domain-containing protein